MDPVTILAAFGPLVVDFGKSIIQKYFAPDEFKPTNISDYIAMRKFDLEFFTAMNNAGGTNPTYPWVEAAVRMMRPTVAGIVLLTWAGVHWFTPEVPATFGADAFKPDTSTVDNFASAIGFYLFGDRTLFYSRKGFKNG